MNHTKNFNQLSKNDADIAGGKGASLGEMLQNNIPVPDGYVVTADTFDYFIKETDLIQEIQAVLDIVDTKVIHTVENASEKIQALIKHAKMPQDIATEVLEQYKNHNMKYVAVRSSATAEDGADHAWAGQLSSYLNTTEDNLLEMVQNCWASLFTPRAIFYRFEKGLDTTHISVAVVVQKMVNSEKSGIAFSVHPVTEDYNQIIIEAGLGLGEAIVSGSVTPDSYVVTKEPQEIIDINVNTQNKALYRSTTLDTEHGFNEWKDLPETEASQQVLNKDQIKELSDIIVTIENHYGFPCDIEWAFEDNIFYIVQSRPITTLKPKLDQKNQILFTKDYTRDVSLIMSQIGYQSLEKPSFLLVGKWKLPIFICHMIDGVIEFWQPPKYMELFQNSLQEYINNNLDTIEKILETYEAKLHNLEIFWEKKVLTSMSELEQFISSISELIDDFNIMYFCAFDERTPEQIRKKAIKLRDKDVYFENSDRLIRDSLIAIYPNLKGYESAILKSEINNPPSKEILAKRKEGFVVIGEEFSQQITLREYLSQNSEYKFHIETPPADSSTLIGQVGNKGYTKGVVRVMKRKDQINEAQEGDIIVSTMTTPDFVPAMKKAAAIITDEGGVTCHAAIVTRELGKSCVIGTKFATQVLKDGDLVEVDADNGIVKILEKEALNLDNYLRMFAGKGLGVLISDIFLQYYNQLGVLSMQDDTAWMSFIPKASQEMTLNEGSVLYTDKDLFSNYKKEFTEFMDSSHEFFMEVLESNDLNTEKIKTFFELTSKHFSFYSKTEFFYTDKIDQSKMIPSVHEFDELKLKGRSFLNKMIFEMGGYVKSLLKKISESTKVSEIDLLNYTIEDIHKLLEDNQKIDVAEIKKRNSFFVGSSKEIYGLESEKSSQLFFNEYREITNTINGKSAYGGIVTGKARVLLPDWKEFDKISQLIDEMEVGEILVAETTSPEIMPAIKKAAAIITNQGGMLSHAAIVAREMKIPCIIGTDKDVILNIQNGDLINVDADKGVISITHNIDNVPSEIGNIDRYQRLFRLQGVRTLINDIYARVYNDYEFFLIIKDGDYCSFITQNGLNRCAREGAEIIATEERFKQYIHSTEELIEDIKKDNAEILSSELNKESVKKFFKNILAILSVYKYTDANFSDGAYQLGQETKDQDIVKRIEELGVFKNEVRDFLNYFLVTNNSSLNLLFKKIGNTFNVNHLDLQDYLQSEILSLFDGGEPLSERQLIQRRKSVLLASKDEKLIYADGGVISSLFDRLLKEEDEVNNQTQVKGAIASPGQVSGYARVISADYDNFEKLHQLFEEMNEGEILVSETTSPDLMPACKKAKGIITNQGGMVSHAAIISREMNIPCIVGTKNATEIIKTGDFVELDATKGIALIKTN